MKKQANKQIDKQITKQKYDQLNKQITGHTKKEKGKDKESSLISWLRN